MKPVSRTPINVVQSGGSITIVDPDTGDVRQVIGQQDDGSYGITTLNAPVPPRPSTPIVVPAQLGITVSWDGLLAGDTATSLVVPESNFEDGFDLWSPGGSTLALGAPNGGAYSLEVTPMSDDGYDRAQVSSPVILVNAGSTYRAQAWVKLTSAVTNGIGLSLEWYADDTILSTDDSFVSSGAGTWVELTNTGVAPAGATGVSIVAALINDPADTDLFLLDDVTLDQLIVNTPVDFDHVEVHISTSSNFGPDSSTLVGTLSHEGSFPVTPLDAVQQYVKLVGVNTSGGSGSASSQAFTTPTEVVATDIPDGVVTTAKLASDVSGAIDTAQGTAEGAASDAAAAQSTATAANSAAGSAVTTANAASTAAGTAQSTATAAQGTANTAVTNAATAQGTANTAVTNAASALSAANSKIKTFIQGTTPTASGTGDLWINTSNGNLLSRWSGSVWTPVPIGAGALAAQLILGSDIIAGDPAKANVTLNAGGLTVKNQDGIATIVFASDGSAVFNGDSITANRVISSVQQINAGTQGGIFMYGSDPTINGPLNADFDFSHDPYTGYWDATGATPSTLFRDTNPDNVYNGYPATLRVIYEQVAGTLVVGEVTSKLTSKITVVPGQQYLATMVVTVQPDVNASIVIDWFNSSGTKLHSDQSSYVTDPGIWQTVTLSAQAPTNAVAATIKCFGRGTTASSGQVNIGYFALSGQAIPLTVSPSAGTDQYGNEYPAGIKAPALTTNQLAVNGPITATAISAPLVLQVPGGTVLNSNPTMTWNSGSLTAWSAVTPGTSLQDSTGTGNIAAIVSDNVDTGWRLPAIVGSNVAAGIVVPGKSYTISGILQQSTAQIGGYISVVWVNSSGGTIGYSPAAGASSHATWENVSLSVVAPANATTCRLRVSWGAPKGQITDLNPLPALFCDYASLQSNDTGQIISLIGNATTPDGKGGTLPAGLSMPTGFPVIASNLPSNYHIGAINIVGPNGPMVVTHNCGFTPDIVLIQPATPNSGTSQWNGSQITSINSTTFTLIAHKSSGDRYNGTESPVPTLTGSFIAFKN